jgi:murein DD-endopeptidase MepM/ murein hydrolase activator NlpD
MRVGQERAVCRVLFAAAVVAIAGVPLMAGSEATAQADPIAEAKQRVEDARREANEAAARYTDTQSSYEQLGDKIVGVERKIATNEARREELRSIAERRAVIAYKTQGSNLSAIFHSESPREGLRSSELLDRANEADNDVVTDLAELNTELAGQRDQLAEQQRDQKAWSDRLADERKVLDAKLADSENALRDLEAQAFGAGRASEVSAPVIDGMVCPSPGSAFSNDWGQSRSGGRSHQGTDMMASMGMANLAVVSGNVTYGDGGAGGMGAYLEGDNGVTYIYYHLSEYVGGPRRVAQGEVIAKVGQTGNASTPHTHFEVRPGGRTATAINPYPTLAKIC